MMMLMQKFVVPTIRSCSSVFKKWPQNRCYGNRPAATNSTLVVKGKEYRDLSVPNEFVVNNFPLLKGQFLKHEIMHDHPWIKPHVLKDMIVDGRVLDMKKDAPVSPSLLNEPAKEDMQLYLRCFSRPNQTDPTAIELDYLFVDDDIICINKPPRLYTQPTGADQMNCVMAVLHALYRNVDDETSDVIPRNVHRLDFETSGALVVALNKVASRRLGQQFENKRVQKTYIAIVEGIIEEDHGHIACGLLGERNGKVVTQVVNDEKGKWSESDWTVLARSPTHPYSLVQVNPLTGRTHQIRAHMGSIGHPLVHDSMYGSQSEGDAFANTLIGRIPLHCASMTFMHPATGEDFQIEAPLLEDMKSALKTIGIEETAFL